jgi:hypothetical protein
MPNICVEISDTVFMGPGTRAPEPGRLAGMTINIASNSLDAAVFSD